MSCNAHVQLVPPGKTTDEFPLLRTIDSWELAFSQFINHFNGDKTVFQFGRFAPHLGSAWLSYLVETFALQPGHVFIKHPNVRYIERFFELFPAAKLILLVRDGRDNVASTVKGGLAKRTHMSMGKRSKARLNHVLFRDFVSAARDWSSSVMKIQRFDEEFRNSRFTSQYVILRYEDIYQQPKQTAGRIFAFMGVPCDARILDRVANVDVVGSSFYAASGLENAVKPNWTATPRTDAFQPVGRWKRWSPLQKALFKRIAGDQLVQMGYEKDRNWQ